MKISFKVKQSFIQVLIPINVLLILYLFIKFNIDLRDYNLFNTIWALRFPFVYFVGMVILVIAALFSKRITDNLIILYQTVFYFIFLFAYPQPYQLSVFSSTKYFYSNYFFHRDSFTREILTKPVYIYSSDSGVLIAPFAHEDYIISLYKFKDTIDYDGRFSIYARDEQYPTTDSLLKLYSKNGIYPKLQQKDQLYWKQLNFINSDLSIKKVAIILLLSILFITTLCSVLISILSVANTLLKFFKRIQGNRDA